MDKRIILVIVCLLALINQVLAEDNVTIKDFSLFAGESKDLNVELDNDVTYAAFQFDLYLPEGISVIEYSADRTRVPEGTTLEMNQQEDGSYRFIAAAMGQEEIKGTSGSIISFKVKAVENLESGNLIGYFRKVKLSMLDGSGATYEEMSFPITIMTLLGDANGDGTVDAGDVVAITDYMMGKSPEKFSKKAADMDDNNVFNIADIIQIVNQICSAK